MDHSLDRVSPPAAEPRVRKVGLTQPFVWLQRGAADLRRAPRPGLSIGAAVAALGALLLAASWKATYLAPALLGGFLLVAPFLAIGLYAVSRQLERGAVDARQAWRSWQANAGSIAMFGLVLALAYLFWERLAAIMFAFFYRSQPLQLSTLPTELLTGELGIFVAVFAAIGAALAGVVFALGVVSAPLLLDRPLDVITATLTSLRCCARNPAPLALWAALIAALTALGFATAMLGLVVVFPLLAHASWHAYRDLVES